MHTSTRLHAGLLASTSDRLGAVFAHAALAERVTHRRPSEDTYRAQPDVRALGVRSWASAVENGRVVLIHYI
jgi:hypothetical protein